MTRPTHIGIRAIRDVACADAPSNRHSARSEGPSIAQCPGGFQALSDSSTRLRTFHGRLRVRGKWPRVAASEVWGSNHAPNVNVRFGSTGRFGGQSRPAATRLKRSSGTTPPRTASLIGRVCQASGTPSALSTSVDRLGVSHASLRSRLDLDRRCTHWSDGAGSHALERARSAADICGFTRTIVHTQTLLP